MSKGVNKVILIGNLGNDPVFKKISESSSVANITLATSDSWNDKETGDKVDKTEWHRVVFFNKLAVIVTTYLKKGSKVFIEGQLRTRKWQDKATGADKYTTEIIASSMQMLDSKSSNTENTSTIEATKSNSGKDISVSDDQYTHDDIPF